MTQERVPTPAPAPIQVQVQMHFVQTPPLMVPQASVSRTPGCGPGSAGFARFPLVEVEDDGDEEMYQRVGGKEKEKRGCTYSAAKAEQAAQLDVQDALLAIRLRGFLRAQDVGERELDVRFEKEGEGRAEGEDRSRACPRSMFNVATPTPNSQLQMGRNRERGRQQ